MVKLGLITNAGVYVDSAENFDITQFPKSRRFITQQNEILPLGWLYISEKGKPEITIEEEKPKTVEQLSLDAKPEYFKGTLKKGSDINAKVMKSGKPNKIKLFIAEDNEPEMDLTGYNNPINLGSIIIVKIEMNNQGKILNVRFVNFKK